MEDVSRRPRRNNDDFDYLRPGDRMGEGDTELVLDILPSELASVAFEKLKEEVKWNTMAHKGAPSIVYF